MLGPLRLLLLLAALLGGACLAAGPQEVGSPKKGEPVKDAKKDRGKPVVDKPALPPGSVIIVPSDFQKGLPVWPGFALIPLEDYQKLKDAADKRPTKADKTLAHSCELTGRLEGDYVALRGEFTFATQEPRTTVVLGLQKAQLTEKGELDGQPPLLGGYSDEDGFTVRVDEPGQHRLVLQLRVPVTSKRPGSGTRAERTLELGLPGTVITTLALELPAAVKEVRCNSDLEKQRLQGKWFFALGKKQTLTLSWREPMTQPGGGPHLAVEGKINVQLAGTDAKISADLLLEDPRGQTRECQLALPVGADVQLEAPAGVAYEFVAPTGKNPNYVLRFLEPNSEQWKVTALLRVPRPAPGSRLAVGPFFVQGAEQQRGTITIEVPPELWRKQRLMYHLNGEVFQHDPPKGSSDIEAAFQYWGLPNPAKAKGPAGARVPLEIELRGEHGPLEGGVENALQLRANGEGWELDLAARLVLQSSHGSGDFIDLQLPRPRPLGTAALAVHASAGFPAAVPWAALGRLRGASTPWAVPHEFRLRDETGALLELPPPDLQGRCRVTLPRGLGKGYVLTLSGKYAVGPLQHRVRVGLPRLLGIREQGSKITVQTSDALELLDGERDRELPVPEAHRYQYAVDETPAFVDVAWRPYRPEFPVEGLVEVVIHGQTAQVKQRLTLAQPPRRDPAQPARAGQLELRVPAGVTGLKRLLGSERRDLVPEHGLVSVTPTDKPLQVNLEYDLRLSEPAADGLRQLELATPWPTQATRLSAKVRIWCEPGTRVRLAHGDAWVERGVEPVPERALLPALVLQGSGPRLPLTLTLDDSAGTGIAALVCDRGLLEADLADDERVACRARYLLSKVNADAVAIEFPARLALCQPSIRVGPHLVAWTAVPGTDERVARVPLPSSAGGLPVLLDIQYQLPRSTQDGAVFGVATLLPPVFRDPVRIGRLRWQVNLPGADTLGVPLTAGARSDFRWAWHRLLLGPEPAYTSADLEAWLLGSGAGGEARSVGLSFWPASADGQRIYYQPRLRWLSALSAAAVLLFVLAGLLRPGRTASVVLVGLLVSGLVVLAVLMPALWPALCFGVQPGLAVVLVVMGLLWLRQERYRRQLVFIPGFTRVKAGSSLVRNGRSSQRARDKSTIDAPAPSGIAGPAPSAKK